VVRHILRRLGAIVVLIVAASMLVFLIIRLIPGDPVVMMLGSNAADTALIDKVRVELGLNLPIYQQYFIWVGNLLHGHFGTSYINDLPVLTLLRLNYPSTLQLTISALVVSVVIGLALGTVAAVKQDTFWDVGLRTIALIGLAMPSFWLGLLLISLFGVTLKWLPVFGGTGWRAVILPALSLGIGGGSVIARFVRSNLLETIRLQHVTVARSKGVSALRVLTRHVIRNAILPIITVIGLQVGGLLSGTVVIEEVFSRPGIGVLLVNSIQDKDYPTVQLVILIFTVVFAVVNLIVDLMYPLLDPRIRYS
jgi:ABC-type dipeptide/oligopeptide/nickel transport system permease component